MKYYSLFIIFFFTVISCKEENIGIYDSDSGISFFIGQNSPDSLTYSFAFSSLTPGATEKSIDTVFINMRLTGKTERRDRKIKVIAKEGSTARENIDFKIPDIILPADSLHVQFPLVVLNTPEMKNKVFSILLEVAPSGDLNPGSIGIDRENQKSLNAYKVLVTNRVEKPSWWGPAQNYYFGPYSEVRYRFMMQSTGLTDFSQEKLGPSQMYNIPVQLRNALLEYEEKFGPLMDGNTRITF